MNTELEIRKWGNTYGIPIDREMMEYMKATGTGLSPLQPIT
ncbi:MAG TPA: hypothetical protein P5046_03000 [Sphaerochaeta sp.]|nr:hypothetical protein [Sphaerochaeta sp.]